MADEQERLKEDIESRRGDAHAEDGRFKGDIVVAVGSASLGGFGVHEMFTGKFFVGAVITAAGSGIAYLKTMGVMDGFENYGRIRERLGNLRNQMSVLKESDKIEE